VSFLGQSSLGGFEDSELLLAEQWISDQGTLAPLPLGNDEAVEHPSTWLFAPIVAQVSRLCEATALEEQKGPLLTASGGFSGGKLPNGGSSEDHKSTDQSSEVPQQRNLAEYSAIQT
jgi:hypothetical protein